MKQKLENGEEQSEDIPIVSLSAEEVLNKINSGGYVYNIKGGLDAFRKLVEEEKKNRKKRRKIIQMGKDYEPMDLSDLDEIREKLLSDPSYNDIEIESTSLEEFLDSIQKPGVKFTTKGGIDELRKRVECEKKAGNIIIEELDFAEYHKFKKEIEEDPNLEGRIRKITPKEVLQEIESGASFNLRESLSNLRDRIKKDNRKKIHDDNTKRF